MARESFWSGFGLGALAGAAAGAATFVAACGRASTYDRRVLRLESGVQIGKPVEEVFAEWSQLENLPQRISSVRRVDVSGQHSNWVLEVDSRPFEFTAETEQLIPNQAIGWKSITGPKHSGRINFARLGNDTLVHVTMNYAPPLGRFGRLLAPITDHLESEIERALRDFKRSLEGKADGRVSERFGSASDTAAERWGNRPPASAGWEEATSLQPTGTEGVVATLNPPGTRVEHQSGKVQTPGAVDYTRPPKELLK